MAGVGRRAAVMATSRAVGIRLGRSGSALGTDTKADCTVTSWKWLVKESGWDIRTEITGKLHRQHEPGVMRQVQGRD
jgi:hypothetical protein